MVSARCMWRDVQYFVESAPATEAVGNDKRVFWSIAHRGQHHPLADGLRHREFIPLGNQTARPFRSSPNLYSGLPAPILRSKDCFVAPFSSAIVGGSGRAAGLLR